MILENIPLLTEDGIMMDYSFSEVRELVCSNADSIEYYITKNNCYVSPSEHLQSLHPSVFWISKSNQMKQISKSIESIVIQGDVGNDKIPFKLSNLPSLITLEMGHDAFEYCHSIVFENLTQLKSIILEWGALEGDARESNELIMRNLPSLTLLKGNEDNNFRHVVKVILKNIPLLTEDGIQMDYSFNRVRELHSSSMID